MTMWPGPDTGVAVFPGPDTGAAAFPGADTGFADFPTPPEFAMPIALSLLGGGIVLLEVIETPLHPLDLVGGGIAGAELSSTSVVDLALSGGGTADVEFGIPITLTLSGGGTVGVDLVPVGVVDVAASGGGTADAAIVPVGAVGLALAGGGDAVFGAIPTAEADLTLSGGGTVSTALTAVPDIPQRIGQSFNSSTTATLTITYPAGSAAGDLILLLVSGARTATGTITFPPNGPTWTVVATNDHGSNSLGAQVLWARRGAETSTTITMTPTSSPSFVVALATAYLGASVNATTPVGPSNTTSAVAGTAVSSAALAGVAANSEVVVLYWSWTSPAGTARSTTWSGAGGAVKRDEQQAAGPSFRVLHTLGTAVQATAGSFGVVTVTPSASPAARGLTVLAVNPAA